MVRTVKVISVFLFLVALSASNGMAEESPSPISLKDTDITPAVARSLPHRDCSTPQKTFLGLLRSAVEGNLRDYLFYLTPEARKDTAGVKQETEISDARARDFAEAMAKGGFQHIRLEAFQAIPETTPTRIVAIVSSVRGKFRARNRYDIDLVQTNGEWKFSAVNITEIERHSTDK